MPALQECTFETDSNLWETLCRSAKNTLPAPQVRNREQHGEG